MFTILIFVHKIFPHSTHKRLTPCLLLGPGIDLASLRAVASGEVASPSRTPQTSPTSAPCAESDVRFELVTGYVYTAPDDMLDSRPGTLMLTDCIDLCRKNATCRSANFETGLCVLFASSADQYPGTGSYKIFQAMRKF